MLTQAQLEFLSKYLHFVPKKSMFSSKHEKAMSLNAQMKIDFEKYEIEKARTDQLLDEVETKINLTKTKIKSIPKDAEHPEVVEFLRKFGSLQTGVQTHRQEISAKHIELINTDEDPPFVQGSVFMKSKAVNLQGSLDRFPEMPDVLESGALPVLYAARTRIAKLKEFDGSKHLTGRIIEQALAGDQPDNKLAVAYKLHGDLCTQASLDIEGMIKSALGSNPDSAPLQIDKAEKRVTLLEGALVAPIKAMTDAINSRAALQLVELAKTNPVAKVEQERMDHITTSVARIDVLVVAVDKNIKDLKTKFTEAEGYKEKTAIQAQLKDEKKRLEDLKAQKATLSAYEDQLALRVGRIEAGAQKGAEGLALSKAPIVTINLMDPQPPTVGPEAKDSLLGGNDKNGKAVDGRYQNLLKMYQRALARVSVDAKLYPGEPDLTDISQDQYDTLTAMLLTGRGLAEVGKDYTKASYLFEESYKLYFTFLSANKFSLPPASTPAPAADVKLDLAIKAAGVELDDFWGYGGDVSGALLNTLDAIKKERDVKVKAAETSADELADLQQRIEAFRAEVARQLESFTPPPLLHGGVVAKKKAADTSNLIAKDLLDLFQTKPVQLSEIQGIPANKLLKVKVGDDFEYHEIQTKRGDTQDRRKDKDIPFEALNMLYERSAMMELLAQDDPMDPASAEAMIRVAQETEEMLNAIKGGGKDYKYVFEQIKECKKLEAEKIFAEWVPDGFYEVKTDLKNFSADYPTKYMPSEARTKIDELFRTLTTKKGAAENLKVEYARVEELIRTVERDMEPKSKKGSDDTPVLRMQAMLKGGIAGIMDGYVTSPQETVRMNELQTEMRAYMNTLTTIGTKDGLEGALAREIETARQKLETKSETGIKNAKTDAEAIRIKMNKQLAELNAPPKPDLAYFEKIGAFLKDLAEGAKKAKDDRDAAQAHSEMIDTKLKAALRILDANKPTLSSYKEYKTVYDSQKKGYDGAVKGFKDDKISPAAAREQFLQQLASASQLEADLSKLTTIRVSEPETVDFVAWQTALTTNIDKIRQAANRAAGTLRSKAAGDDPTVVTAADDAAKVLELAGAAEVSAIVTFKLNLTKIVNDAKVNPPGEARKKAMALAREQALAEVRRMRVETEKHPALTVYRDNPMDKGASWPQFASTLHSLDVEILTKLNPA